METLIVWSASQEINGIFSVERISTVIQVFLQQLQYLQMGFFSEEIFHLYPLKRLRKTSHFQLLTVDRWRLAGQFWEILIFLMDYWLGVRKMFADLNVRTKQSNHLKKRSNASQPKRFSSRKQWQRYVVLSNLTVF